MAFCEQCGAELSAGALFCQECGKPVPEPVVRLCAGCGQQLPADAVFCPSCGLSANAKVAVEAERTGDALVLTVTDVSEGLVFGAAEPEKTAEEASGEQESVVDFQMDLMELSNIVGMLAEGVQTDQQRLLDLVRQTTSSTE